MKLRNLSILTGLLFLASLMVYTQDNLRGTDLVAGSDFIKGLDVTKIHAIRLSFKDDKSISFKRSGDHFVLSDHKAYPASTAAINELIFKIANLQVKEKVASSLKKDTLKQFELEEKKSYYRVQIFDANDKEIVGFRVGKAHKGGRYLYKEGQENIYLSSSSLWINSSYKDFIETVLLDLKKKDIEEVLLKADQEIQLAREDGKFKLKKPEGLKAKDESIEKYLSSFGMIEFQDYFQYNDPEVFGLSFKEARVKLNNSLIYKLEVAEKNQEHYLRVTASVDEMPKHFTVSQEDGVEKLRDIESIVKAQGQAQRFNLEKGGWVYKINKGLFKRLVKKSNFFRDS